MKYLQDKIEYLSLHRLNKDNMVNVAQLVRALDCGSKGRGFEPHLSPQRIGFAGKLETLVSGFFCIREGRKNGPAGFPGGEGWWRHVPEAAKNTRRHGLYNPFISSK